MANISLQLFILFLCSVICPQCKAASSNSAGSHANTDRTEIWPSSNSADSHSHANTERTEIWPSSNSADSHSHANTGDNSQIIQMLQHLDKKMDEMKEELKERMDKNKKELKAEINELKKGKAIVEAPSPSPGFSQFQPSPQPQPRGRPGAGPVAGSQGPHSTVGETQKKKRPKSKVWDHFEKIANSSDVICQICQTQLKGQKSYGTNTMWNHLRCVHKGLYKSLRPDEEGKPTNEPSMTEQIDGIEWIKYEQNDYKLNPADRSPDLAISENGNVAKYSESNPSFNIHQSFSSVRAVLPIPLLKGVIEKPTIAFYYEVEILAKTYQIGFCDQHFQLQGESLGTGNNNSIGFSRNDGIRQDNTLDHFGIGIIQQPNYKMEYFATKNGELLKKIELLPKFNTLNLFPVVSLLGVGEQINVHFDRDKWRFKKFKEAIEAKTLADPNDDGTQNKKRKRAKNL